MHNYKLSGFADEISPKLSVQLSEIKNLGMEYIEVRGINGRNISEYSPEEFKEIKKELDGTGVKISSIGSPIGKYNIDKPFEPHFEEFKNILKLAEIAETKYIRIFSFFPEKGKDPSYCREEVLKRMDAFVKAAEAYDVVLLHENEKDIYGDTAERCFDILKSIGSDKLKAVFDPANFVQCKEETYPGAFNLLKPYIEYMHIKDADKDGNVVPAGMGDGRVKEILKSLSDANYSGFLSLEPHLVDFAGFADLELDDNVKLMKDSGVKAFKTAYNALDKILKEI